MIPQIVKPFIRKNLYPFVPFVLKLLPNYQDLVLKYCCIGKLENSKGILGRLVLISFNQDYWKLPIGERLDVQTRLMGDVNGVDWAKNYQSQFEGEFPPPRGMHKIGELDFHDARPNFERINKYLTDTEDCCTVIQLGASSGRDIAYFSKNHSRHIFYYTDIFDSVVEYASNVHRYPNLHFLTATAENLHLIASATQGNSVLIFSMGSSQYVYPEHLDQMFLRLSKINDKTIVFYVNEPAHDREVDPLTFNESIPRGNFSYTHNYSYYAIKNSFQVLDWEKISVYVPQEDYPGHFGTVHLSGIFLKERN